MVLQDYEREAQQAIDAAARNLDYEDWMIFVETIRECLEEKEAEFQ